MGENLELNFQEGEFASTEATRRGPLAGSAGVAVLRNTRVVAVSGSTIVYDDVSMARDRQARREGGKKRGQRRK